MATIAKNFKIEREEPDQVVKPEARFTAHPEGGMQLRVRRSFYMRF